MRGRTDHAAVRGAASRRRFVVTAERTSQYGERERERGDVPSSAGSALRLRLGLDGSSTTAARVGSDTSS